MDIVVEVTLKRGITARNIATLQTVMEDAGGRDVCEVTTIGRHTLQATVAEERRYGICLMIGMNALGIPNADAIATTRPVRRIDRFFSQRP